MDPILEQLERIEKLITNQSVHLKEILNLQEVHQYSGMSVSHLYKLTSTNKIPHYKPNGKIIYFRKSELDEWLLKNKVYSEEEIKDAAQSFILRPGR